MYPDRAKIVVSTLNDDRENRILKHVSTLFHEMIHAFLRIYKNLICNFRRRFHDGYGYTGYGIYWHDIAYALQKAVKSSTGITLDLGRKISMVIELQQARITGERIDLTKWGLLKKRDSEIPGIGACSTFNPGANMNPKDQIIAGGQVVEGGIFPYGVQILGPAGRQHLGIQDLVNMVGKLW
jgi:hypothetical protein